MNLRNEKFNCSDEEAVLLGTWLKGKHLEDIKKIDPGMFHYSQVVRSLDKGWDALKIIRETKYTASELMSMTLLDFPVLYSQTLRSYINKKLERELQGIKVDEEGIEKLKELIANQNALSINIEPDRGITEQYLQEFDSRKNQDRVLWSKLPTLNRLTNGIKRKQLTTIAGRPSSGKSAFALQVALGVAESGHKILFFPLEMSDNETIDRILIHKGVISSKEASSGKISPEQMKRIEDYVGRLEKDGCFKFYEGIRDIESIEEAVKREKPFAIVIDQLTQMRSIEKSFQSIREQFTYMTSNLKAIAMRHDVAVILLCQINRGAEEQKPTMANLKESGSIEEDSDNIIMIYRTPGDCIRDYVDWKRERPMTVILAKQRSGGTDEFQTRFEPSRMLFCEVAM